MKSFIHILIVIIFSCAFPLQTLAKKTDQPTELPADSRPNTITRTDTRGEGEHIDEATKQYLRSQRMRRTGGVLLGTGLGLATAGAVLVEIDAWGKIGVAGFSCLGAGLGLSITGMFLLGFAKKIPKDTKINGFSAIPASRGQGIKLVYSRSF